MACLSLDHRASGKASGAGSGTENPADVEPLLLGSDGGLHLPSKLRWPSAEGFELPAELQAALLKCAAGEGVVVLHEEVLALLMAHAPAGSAPLQPTGARAATLACCQDRDTWACMHHIAFFRDCTRFYVW